jgi:hypothetical protein
MDCRRRSTSQTVYSLCSYVTGWHGVDSARIETGMRKTKRARPSFKKFSTTILFDLLNWLRRYPGLSRPATHAEVNLGRAGAYSRSSKSEKRKGIGSQRLVRHMRRWETREYQRSQRHDGWNFQRPFFRDQFGRTPQHRQQFFKSHIADAH